MTRRTRLGLRVGVGAVLLALLGGCAHAAEMAPTSAIPANATGGGAPAASLRLGYFANLTHSTPIVGVAKGFYGSQLGSTKLTTDIFADGPDEMTALLSGQLDAAYVGPSSALSAYTASHGTGLEIIAGAEIGAPSSSSHRASPAPQTCAARLSPTRNSATLRTSRCAPGCYSRAFTRHYRATAR